MSIDDEEPFVLVTSKRQKTKNSTHNRQLRSRKSFLLTAEDDDKTFVKAAELR